MSTLAAPLSWTIGRVMQSGESVNDASSTHRLQLIAAGLALLGIVLIGFTIWYWRATRPEHRALAPLEVMSDRKWRSADTGEQRRSLDEVRAPDSPVLATARVAAPPTDFAVLAAGRLLPSIDDHAGFGDLVEATVTPEGEPHAGEPAVVEPDRPRPSLPWPSRPWTSRRSSSQRPWSSRWSSRSSRRSSARAVVEPVVVEPDVERPCPTGGRRARGGRAGRRRAAGRGTEARRAGARRRVTAGVH